MELTKERLIVIIISGIIIITLGLYLFLYRPLISKLRTTHLQCKTMEAEVIQARNAIAALKMIGVKKGLIPEEDISLAIDELTKQGKLKGINFVAITPKEIKESNDRSYKICPIEIEIESAYEQISLFLGSLEDLEKSIVTVRSFNIAPKGSPAKLRTKLTLNLYLISQNAE